MTITHLVVCLAMFLTKVFQTFAQTSPIFDQDFIFNIYSIYHCGFCPFLTRFADQKFASTKFALKSIHQCKDCIKQESPM